MANPVTKQEFIDYTMRALGAPVVQVNVAQSQADDRFSEALNYMHERNYEFSSRCLFAHQITAEEQVTRASNVDTWSPGLGATGATTSASYWPLGSDIVTIETVYSLQNTYMGEYMFDLRYQMALYDVFGLYWNTSSWGSMALGSYESTMSYMQLIDDIFNYPVNFTFANSTRRLTLDTKSTDLHQGKYILCECYVRMDIDKYPALYSNRIFKKYFAALLKKQWGQNLMPFQNVPMPGGIMMNGAAISEQADIEIQQIEQEIKISYEQPPTPMIG